MMELHYLSTARLEYLEAALLHSLWQGPLIALGVYVLLGLIPASRAALRYGISVAGLLGIIVAILVTWQVSGGPANLELGMRLRQAAYASLSSVSPEIVAGPSLATMPRPLGPERPDIPVILYCWFVGVVLMTARIGKLMYGTGQLRDRCRLIEDARILTIVEDMCLSMHVSQRVVLRMVHGIVSPQAMGLIWPIVLLPAAIVTGLSPGQLRAILAHELAHIRRYDYLVNFIQLIVEALLYFNPAVWWLSRRIRIERESCCDAMASAAAGGALVYNEALAHVARHAPQCRNVLSTAQTFGAGSLLARIRRLLIPGNKPKLRLRWYSVAAGVWIALALSFGLFESSVFGVQLAGGLLAVEERVAFIYRMLENDSSVVLDMIDGEANVHVSGRVALPWYQSLSEISGQVTGISVQTQFTSFHPLTLTGRRFKGDVGIGDIYVTAEISGYAPALAGPFRGDETHPLEGLRIRIVRSQPVKMRFIDPEGNPLAGVFVEGGYRFLNDAWRNSIQRTSDDNGLVVLDQASPPFPLALEVKADGFQPVRDDRITINPGETFDWVLQFDEPIHGTVVDSRNGAPIRGARITLAMERGQGTENLPNGELLATSGVDGAFTLHGLNRERVYYVLISAPGFGHELAAVPADLDQLWRIPLAPRYVRGVIRGDLTLLKTGEATEDRVISVTPIAEITQEDKSAWFDQIEVPVFLINDEAHFEISDLPVSHIFIEAGPKSVGLDVFESVEDFVIDLTDVVQTVERPLIIRFVVPESTPPVAGRVEVSHQLEGGNRWSQVSVDVVDGVVQTTVEAPSRIGLTIKEVDGYLPAPMTQDEREKLFRVPAGDGPYTVEVPLERAGAIRGRVFHADGTPAADVGLTVLSAKSDFPHWPNDYDYSMFDRAPRSDARGEFAVLPLPLETVFSLGAQLGFTHVWQEVSLSESKPVLEIELRLPECVDVPVQVLKPDGQPMSSVALSVHNGNSDHSGWSTDAQGRYVLRRLDATQVYWLSVEPHAQFQVARVRLTLDGRENVVRLEEGVEAYGIVLMAGSETPVPNYGVVVRAVEESPPGWVGYETQCFTDSEGKFRFSTLCPGEFIVKQNEDSDYRLVQGDEGKKFVAAQEMPVVIHVRPRDSGS